MHENNAIRKPLSRRQILFGLASLSMVMADALIDENSGRAFAARGVDSKPIFGKLVPETYRNFTYDIARLEDDPNAAELITRVQEQIDMIYAAHLPQAMLDNIKLYPMTILAEGKDDNYHRGMITIAANTLSKDKPILLHEYLHCIHDTILENGFSNGDIIAFYHKAVAQADFPRDSYFYKNPAEFFAMTGTAVLNGKILRAPFTREQVRKTMPEYYQWLVTLFEAKFK